MPHNKLHRDVACHYIVEQINIKHISTLSVNSPHNDDLHIENIINNSLFGFFIFDFDRN